MPSYEALGPVFHNAIIPQFVAARKKLKISQLEMDEVLGVAKGLVSKWECGMRKPGAFLFSCWADALECKIQLAPKKKNESA